MTQNNSFPVKGQVLGSFWEVVRDRDAGKEFVVCYDSAVAAQEYLLMRADSPSLRFFTVAASPALREVIAGLQLCDCCGLRFVDGDSLRVTNDELIVHESCENPSHCVLCGSAFLAGEPVRGGAHRACVELRAWRAKQ